MISPGIFASIRDINGPAARIYSERDTVYISPTGNDGFLGATPDLPVKTFAAAKRILKRIKQTGPKPRYLKLKGGEYNNPTPSAESYFTYEDSNINDEPLTIQPYGDGKVTLLNNYTTLTGVELLQSGLCKIKLPRDPVYIQPYYKCLINIQVTFRTPTPEYAVWLGQEVTPEDYAILTSLNEDISQFFEFVPAGGVSRFYEHFNTEYTTGVDVYIYTHYSNWETLDVDAITGDEYRDFYFSYTLALNENSPVSLNVYDLIYTYNPDLDRDIFEYVPGVTAFRPTRYASYSYTTGYFLNDKRIVPARFPKRSVYDYTPYPTVKYTTIIAGASADRISFRIKDTTNFLTSLTLSATNNIASPAYNPSIAYNVDYNGSPSVATNVVNISSIGNSMFSVTASEIYRRTGSNQEVKYIPTGLQIFGYCINYPEIDLSNTAANLCTEEGEFVVSKEDVDYFVYVKPYYDTPVDNIFLTIREPNYRYGIQLNGANNIKIHDINFKYFYTGLTCNQYSRNIAITGCRFEKVAKGVEASRVANLTFNKNIIFDTDNSGIRCQVLSGAKISNNIIKYNGVVQTAHSESIGFSVLDWRGRPQSNATRLLSATSNTFTINLTAVNPIPYGNRASAMNSNWGGYLEVQSGDFKGQRRIVNDFYRYGPNAQDPYSGQPGTPSGYITYGIVDPWTPVNGNLAPLPGDMVQYVVPTDANGYTYGNRGINNVVDHNFVKYSGAYCLQTNFNIYNTISSNYFSNASYGYSGDLGVVYMASMSSNLINNIIENGRRGPGRYNGFALYLDYNHNRINVEKNIISTSDQVFFGHNSINITLQNNIIKGSRGALLNFQHTGQQFNISNRPDQFQFKAFRNIFIASSSVDYLFYRLNPNPIPVNDYRGFQGYSVYNPAHRIVHENLSAPNDEYRSFTISSDISAEYLNGFHHGSCFHRCGTLNNYPAFVHSEYQHAFYVKNGNWVLGTAGSTTGVSISSRGAVATYRYPWSVPSNEWFRVTGAGNASGNLDIDFDTSKINKRNTPLFHTFDNIHYTDVLNFRRNITPSLSSNFYAWMGTRYPSWSTANPPLCASVELPNGGGPSYAETQEFWNGPIGTNIYPVSAGFERLVPWEENSIFADPKINPSTYQLAPDSPALAKGFEQIDTADIGLLKDDPEWLQLAEDLTSRPYYGDADYAEYKYGNHNDPFEYVQFNTVADLRAMKPTKRHYRTDTIARDGNVVQLLGEDGGLFRYKYTGNTIPDDGANVIKPNSGNNYRWLRTDQ